MDEFDLIARFFKRDKTYAHVPVNIGDDCAVVDLPAGSELAFSVDTLLPDVHFFAQDDPALIAERSLRVSLSDLAAMGAEPLCFTLALSLPHADEQWLESFSQGLHQTADQLSCPLVGGDTVRGPLAISIHVQGHIPRGKAIRRSGAQIGDVICVSGPMGDGAAALQSLKGELSLSQSASEYFHARFHRPEPQFSVGVALRDLANSAIDVSDGLVADLGHICKASKVAAELDLESIPLAYFMQAEVERSQALKWALNGGDDYHLCFTLPESKIQDFEALNAATSGKLAIIGRIVEGEGVRSLPGQEAISTLGYSHFG